LLLCVLIWFLKNFHFPSLVCTMKVRVRLIWTNNSICPSWTNASYYHGYNINLVGWLGFNDCYLLGEICKDSGAYKTWHTWLFLKKAIYSFLFMVGGGIFVMYIIVSWRKLITPSIKMVNILEFVIYYSKAKYFCTLIFNPPIKSFFFTYFLFPINLIYYIR
jgi:hypothetical protein